MGDSEHLHALEAFERDYRRYIAAQEAEYHFRDPNLSDDERHELRRSLLRRVDGAERALRAADKVPQVAPGFGGGPILTALSDQIFAHERPGYGGTEGHEFDLPNGLLDTMCAALGTLEDQQAEKQAEEQQRDEAWARLKPGFDELQRDLRKHMSQTPAPAPVPSRSESTGKGRPTLWGHLRRVPGWVASAADFITVGGVLIGAAKLLGLW